MNDKKEFNDMIKKKNQHIILFSLLIFLFLSIVIGISFGSISIPFGHSISILFDSITNNISPSYSNTEKIIILQLRLPRVFMAVIVGAMLSIAGIISQNIFKNPLADPYIIGVSSSAGFGSAFTMVLGLNFLGKFTIPFVSFIFSLICILIIFSFVYSKQKISMYSLLLAGIAISYIFSSLTSLILFLSADKSHMILSTLLGKLWGSSWEEVFVSLSILFPLLIILFFYSRELNILLLGDETAESIGVNVKKTRFILIIIMTLLSATSVAFCGTIAFVGLIVPHITRTIFGNDHKRLIAYSSIIGAILLVWADLLARIVFSPLEIPVGIFTTFMGGPFFIFLIIKNQKKKSLN